MKYFRIWFFIYGLVEDFFFYLPEPGCHPNSFRNRSAGEVFRRTVFLQASDESSAIHAIKETLYVEIHHPALACADEILRA